MKMRYAVQVKIRGVWRLYVQAKTVADARQKRIQCRQTDPYSEIRIWDTLKGQEIY